MFALPPVDGVAVKNVLIALAFGSGLIPSISLANKQAVSSLMEAASAEPASTDSPALQSSPFLFYPTPPRVADVLAVVNRLDAAALKTPTTAASAPPLGKGFMGAELEEGWRPERPAARRLLRRVEFSDRIAKLPARRGWPTEADGSPVGGAALRDELGASLARRPLNAVAIDAVWVALSGGSSYLSPEELDRQLARWRPDDATVRLADFERALLQGRATIVGGYVVLFGLQAMVLAVFVLGPLLEGLEATT